MNFNILEQTIAFALKGSRAYGLETENSDYDYTGIFIPPREYFFGFTKHIEQCESIEPYKKFYKEKVDISKKNEGCVYELRKFLKLASNCNPNVIEILWVEPEDFFIRKPEFEKIHEIRDLFLSKKARFTFSGYAFSQIKRCATHRSFILSPPTRKPTRGDYNLPEICSSQYEAAEALIRKEIEHWAFHDLDLSLEVADAIREKIKEQLAYTLATLNLNLSTDILDESYIRKAAMNKIGFDDNMFMILEKEHVYRKELDNFKNYEIWKKTRNPERAKLEEKYHYDSKNALHVVRLLRMGEEILSQGKVIVKRPDREELLAIRNGAWTYEQLLEYAENMQKKLDRLYKTSSLRKAPDVEKIEKVCIELVENSIFRKV